MNTTQFEEKIIKAAKWSTLTEIAAKLVIPITNMILARLLVPEAFGVLATITMIISFAEMFADAGFQKYLIQHEFKNEQEKSNYANVAFWTNFVISIFLWGLLALFSNQIAAMVGNPGLGMVIVIACFQLPITAFSSIQMSLYRRNLDFRPLFLTRIISIFIPFFITIPFALMGFNYWSLIIGNIINQLSTAFILTVKSNWKPRTFYNLAYLKEMLSFSVWSLVEAISIWMTSWVDSFIIGSVLNSYYLGLYKTSLSIVNSLMAIITSATVPVLFSALSRLQDNDERFNHIFFQTQKVAAILVFPLSVGIFLYRDLATEILLGGQWSEASSVIGHWALTSGILIVYKYYCSEVYRAKGRPMISFLSQVLHLVVLIPACIISSRYGFWVLVYVRSWIRITFFLVDFPILKLVFKIPILKIMRNTFPTVASASVMGVTGYFLQHLFNGIVWTCVSIMTCVLFYFGLLCLFPSMRKLMISILTFALKETGIRGYQRKIRAN